MNTWKLTIEYEGTRYRGWQEQKNARTIAGEIKRAAREALGCPFELGGAGRTDAGVHALAQAAHLRAEARCSPRELKISLNDRLPADINILAVESCRQRFDARRDAMGRSYLYQISTRRTALGKHFVWWIKDRLNVVAMERASRSLIGRHDFALLSERDEDERSTIVVVDRIEIGLEDDLLLIRIAASHFLWKMVRRIVGALVEIGRGRLTPEQFAGLLNEKRPSAASAEMIASHTAPPSGLFLHQVLYEGDVLAPFGAAVPVQGGTQDRADSTAQPRG
ncbi:MAG: tRNA pseudouridine(38-40) synthase TruA [Blastocatellia bacterium AA13]|nr:MAG: tRNA pseudouridine(38-40) synthase TruA [Blastocatellia bacterium AA13]